MKEPWIAKFTTWWRAHSSFSQPHGTQCRGGVDVSPGPPGTRQIRLYSVKHSPLANRFSCLYTAPGARLWVPCLSAHLQVWINQSINQSINQCIYHSIRSIDLQLATNCWSHLQTSAYFLIILKGTVYCMPFQSIYWRDSRFDISYSKEWRRHVKYSLKIQLVLTE